MHGWRRPPSRGMHRKQEQQHRQRGSLEEKVDEKLQIWLLAVFIRAASPNCTDAGAAQKLYLRAPVHRKRGLNDVSPRLHHLFNLEETLRLHAKTSTRGRFSISWEWNIISEARCEADLHLRECGSATLDGFSSSCPSWIRAVRAYDTHFF